MNSSENTRANRDQGATVRTLLARVTSGPDAPFTFGAEAGLAVSVGTAKDNDFVLSDMTVSRYHIELSPHRNGIQVRDLGSRNGTFFDGVRIERGIVPPSTTLRLGETTIQIGDRDVGPGDGVAFEPQKIPGIVAESPQMRGLLRDVERAARSDVSVLLTGETGTGKEVLARAIHDLGARCDRPFVVVDCGALPATLIASELFGHERGAFTGAERQRIGAFEMAHQGTLFLDEIGELPIEVQPVLLGALERRCFRRVGGQRTIDVDVRLVSATHRDLRTQVNNDGFRADLYFRLAVAKLSIPPLRERPQDIAPLVQSFAEQMDGGADVPFGAEALTALKRQRWSGNVRELRNVVEAALAMGRLSLEETGRGRPENLAFSSDESLPTYKDARELALATFEASYLAALMRRTSGNASQAARVARMARPYLLRLLKRHRLR